MLLFVASCVWSVACSFVLLGVHSAGCDEKKKNIRSLTHRRTRIHRGDGEGGGGRINRWHCRYDVNPILWRPEASDPIFFLRVGRGDVLIRWMALVASFWKRPVDEETVARYAVRASAGSRKTNIFFFFAVWRLTFVWCRRWRRLIDGEWATSWSSRPCGQTPLLHVIRRETKRQKMALESTKVGRGGGGGAADHSNGQQQRRRRRRYPTSVFSPGFNKTKHLSLTRKCSGHVAGPELLHLLIKTTHEQANHSRS